MMLRGLCMAPMPQRESVGATNERQGLRCWRPRWWASGLRAVSFYHAVHCDSLDKKGSVLCSTVLYSSAVQVMERSALPWIAAGGLATRAHSVVAARVRRRW
jgi:hypothetical protein